MSEGFEQEVRETLEKILAKLSEHEAKDEGRHADLVARDREIRQRVEDLEEAKEHSGRFQIMELQKRLERNDEAWSWLRRNWLVILMTVLASAVSIYSAVRK